MQSGSQKQQLRLKIKKLKYKIQKQQKMQQEYNRILTRIKRFDQQKLSIGRVLKKINYLLQVKGMSLIDWIRAYPYEQDLQIDRLVRVLQKISIRLPRQQKGLLINFMVDQLCQQINIDDLKKILIENGLELND